MKLVRNAVSTPELKTNQLINIAVHLKAAKVRHDRMNGRPHLVVPCVMMTEGVHEGSEGPLYYPPEELSRDTGLWNNKPVVVYHPTRNGSPVSACDPDIIDRYGVGVLMNSRWDGSGLKSECWIEEDKARQVDNRILEALDSEQVLEVSTGLFLDVEGVEGEWNGEKYKGIARNHRPDHLAILPDQKGACSVEDGAGLLRNASEGEDPKSKLANYHLGIVNELSANDKWKGINDAIHSSVGSDAWVVDIWDEFIIYDDGKGGTWYQQYEIKEDQVKLMGVRASAELETRYKLSDGSYVGNVAPNQEDSTMNEEERKELVDKLIAHAKSPYKEEDREQLMAMNEDHLKWVSNTVKEPDPEPEKKTKPETAPEPKVTETKPTGNEDSEPTVEEFIAKAPKGIQDVLRSGVAAHAAEKAGLIQKITANERNPFSEEELEAKGLTELKGLVQLSEVPEPQTTDTPRPHFGGQGPVAHKGTEKEEPLVAPTLNFESKD